MKSALKAWLHAQFIAPLLAERGPRTRRSLRDRRGVALILALLFIVLLTVLVVEFSYETQVDASLAANSTGDLEAYLAAKSAVAQGMSMLWDHLMIIQRGELDVPGGLTGGTGAGTGPNPINPTGGEPYDSKYDQWAVGIPFEPLNDATMRVTIADEYGKLNLNALFSFAANGEPQERPEMVETLRQFFITRLSGGDTKGTDGGFDPTDAILDWLDYGESDDERSDGAEDDYYMGLENPYHCKNGPMDSIEELLLIKGITPEIYFGVATEDEPARPLSDFLTVHGHWGGAINVNTAQPEIIEAMAFGYNAGGRPINMAAMNELLGRLGAGETIYSMSQLQQIGGGSTQTNPNNNNQNNPNNQNNDQGNRNNNRTTRRDAPAGEPLRLVQAALPRPQAIFNGFWQPHAALGRSVPTIDLRPQQIAQRNSDGGNGGGRGNGSGNGNGNGNGGGGRGNGNGNGGGGGGGGGNNALLRPFVISSNCFRIYGDGMQGDVLVRIEAYVWRNNPNMNPQEMQAMLPPQLAQQWTPPTENFRILDWKVIR